MEHTGGCRFLWQKKPDETAALIRMYGETAEACVPEAICGYPVTELAPYCFASAAHLPEGEISEEVSGDGALSGGSLRELCGDFVESIYLPDSVHKIGNCAFYNCRKLETLSLGAHAESIGSDSFMNTVALRRIVLRASAREPSGLKQILSQISTDIEVAFCGENGIEALLLYPEYYELYDEIAPAHIFGRSISGEGFRARESIKNGIVDFAAYDGIFSQACVEESETTLLKFALNRLRFPCELAEKSREAYLEYISSHLLSLIKSLTKQREMKILQFLCQNSLLNGENLSNSIRIAADNGWTEGTAYLLQQNSVLQTTQKKLRYEFDGFC